LNTKDKGDRLVLMLRDEARARDLDFLKVRASGHMGRRGGIPADAVVAGWRVEAKNRKRGLGTRAIEDILTKGEVHAVLHHRDRGLPLVTLALNDWLDLLARLAKAAERAGKEA